MNLPSTRKEALAQGSKHYYTGEPCKHGHFAKRHVTGRACCACVLLASKAYYKAPRGRESRIRCNQYYKHNPHGKALKKAHNSRRRARKRDSLPPWADISSIDAFCRACPDGHHIDHIIPLNGENVCGLHVLENLQYLPAQENLSKRNKIDPLTLEANVCVLPDHRQYVAPLGSSGS